MRKILLPGLAVVAAAALVLVLLNAGGDTGMDTPGGPAPAPAEAEAPRPEPPPAADATEEEEDGAGETGRLAVLVRREDDSPLAGVTVRAGRIEGRTDDEGRAALAGVPAGKPIVVRAEGKADTDVPAEEKVKVAAGGEQEVVLVIREGGSVTGAVHDEDGASLSVAFEVSVSRLPDGMPGNAPVPVSFGRFARRSETRSFPAGTAVWEIRGLEPGRYVASAKAEGRVEASSSPFEITKGAVTRGVEIELTLGGRVSGVVVRARTGEPVKGAAVSLGQGGGANVFFSSGGRLLNPSGLSAKTDDQGRFEIDGVPAGTYDLRADAKDLAPGVVEKVAVDAGRTVNGLLLELGEGGGITGTVYDEHGQPVPGAEVLVQPVKQKGLVVMGDVGTHAKADGNGVYLVEHLEPGRYRVKRRVSNSGSVVMVSRVVVTGSGGEKPDDEEPDDGTTVLVREGVVSRFDLRSETLASIRVTLEDAEGKPLDRQRLQLVELDVEKPEPQSGLNLTIPRMGMTDGKGTFAFEGLPPGRYRVVANGAEREVSVGAGRSREVTLRVSLGSIEGVVVDESGKPVAGARVQVRRIRESNAPLVDFVGSSGATTGEDGRFRADDLGPGRYRLSAAAGDRQSSAEEVDLGAGGTVRDIRLVAESTVDVVVSVRDAGGKPVPGVFVSLRDDENSARGGRTDEKGEATVRIRPGSYTAMAFDVADGKQRRAEQSVVVGRGGTPRVELRLE